MTDAGITLRIERDSLAPMIADIDIATLVGPAEALVVGDLVKANLAAFEEHGPIRPVTIRSRLKGRLQDMRANLLNLRQAGELLTLLEAHGPQGPSEGRSPRSSAGIGTAGSPTCARTPRRRQRPSRSSRPGSATSSTPTAICT